MAKNKSPARAKKRCCGCGSLAERHPMVAICHVEKSPPSKGQMVRGMFVRKPVCLECWADPAHRKRPIIGTFCDVRDAELALLQAGSSRIAVGG